MADKFTVFFFSLDEILDTRLATLDMIDPVATLEILQNGYFEREIDDWHKLSNGKIDNDNFKQLYKNRTKETLMKSRLTNFATYMQKFIVEAETLFGTDPTLSRPKILLNLYPYTDLDELEIETIKNAVSVSCHCLITELEVICLSPQEIHPLAIKLEYDFTFMYDFETWKNIHINSISKRDMMGCYVTAPRLFIDKQPSEDTYEIDEGLRMTPWQAAELCLLPFMNLNLIPVKNFSLFLP